MPENESLAPSAREANRWEPFRMRLARGESPQSLFPELQDEFHRAVRRAYRCWKGFGVDPRELFEAAVNDPHRLRELVSRTRHNGFAQLLEVAADTNPGGDLNSVARSFLEAGWDHIRDNVRLDSGERGVPGQFLGQVDRMLDRMSQALARNPGRAPSSPRRNTPPPDIGDILGESLPLA